MEAAEKLKKMLSKSSNSTGPFEKKLWRIMQQSNKPYKRKV